VRPGSRCWVLLCLILPALSPAARAEVFLSPGLEARFGYTSNRFLEEDAQGSAFTLAAPNLEVSAFLPRDVEIGAVLRYRRTDYLRSGFGHVEEATGRATANRPFGAWTGSLELSAGTYRDPELEDDDSRWVAFAPGVSWLAAPRWSLSLGGSVTATRYDSRDTKDGESQRDTRWEVRPGVLWTPDTNTQLWAELYGELNRSNEPTEEFNGGGVAAGVDLVIFGATRAGAWARYGARAYLEAGDSGEEDRHDAPLSAGAWAAVRLAPWAELTAGTTWMDYRSTEDDEAYRAWTVEGGLRIVYDWEATAE
jgi:hypothetical protein